VIRRPAVILAVETAAVLFLAWFGIHHYGLSGALAGSVLGTLLFSAWILPLMLGKTLHPGGSVEASALRDLAIQENAAPSA
jgi:hypothetical protein